MTEKPSAEADGVFTEQALANLHQRISDALEAFARDIAEPELEPEAPVLEFIRRYVADKQRGESIRFFRGRRA